MANLTRENNYCLRGMTEDGLVRFYIANTTDLCTEAAVRHNTSAAATIALGRLLTGTLLSGLMLKGDQSVTVRVAGDGPLVSLTAVADAHGHVRGFSQETVVTYPECWPRMVDIGFAVGRDGTFAVSKDLGLKEPYVGRMPLVSGEIGDEFAYYYTESEQIPSLVALSVLLDNDAQIVCAGGCIAQLMPGAGDDVIDKIEANLEDMPEFSELLANGVTPEGIAERLFKGLPWKTLDKVPVFYSCNCSKDKLHDILYGIGEKELQELLEKQGQAEIVCRFCEEPYVFDADELKQILAELHESKEEQ